MGTKARTPITIPKGQAIRTKLYGRVVELFPEGWMTTGLLSRESKWWAVCMPNGARAEVPGSILSEFDEDEKETDPSVTPSPRYR
jgi:hypothetical protein